MEMKTFAMLLLLASHTVTWAEEPVEVDLERVGYGQLVGVNVDGGPFFIVKRSAEEVALLKAKYGERNLRSETDDFVLIRNYGAAPDCVFWHAVIRDKRWVDTPVFASGGFVDSCTAAQYDLTGRLIFDPMEKGLSEIPIAPHYFKTASTVVVGQSRPKGAAHRAD